MSISECYVLLNGSYEDIYKRFAKERLIERFMLRFLHDDSMERLHNALAAKDYEEAFLSAYSLKGVAANLGFTALYESASALTEFYRNNRTIPDQAILQEIEDNYNHTINVIKAYQCDRKESETIIDGMSASVNC